MSSATFVATSVFMAGGAAFALGNIFLARLLPPPEYGVVALFLALNQVGMPLGVAGVNVVVNRHRTSAALALAMRVGVTGAAAGALMVICGVLIYGLDGVVPALLFVAVLAGSLNRAGAALFQAEQRTGWMLVFEQWTNYMVLASAPLAAAFALTTADPIVGFVAAGYAVAALLAWAGAVRWLPKGRSAVPERVMRREGFSVMGIAVAAMALSQAERLVIPLVLSLELLGAYAVLAAFVGSPFRMLQAALAVTLLPRLTALRGRAESLALLAREAVLAAAFASIMFVMLWWLAPVIFDIFLQGEYDISQDVILAALVVGCIKVWQGLANAAVQGLGGPRALFFQNVSGWIALALALALAPFGARWGLVGVVYAVGAGWLWLAVVGTFIALLPGRAAREPSEPTRAV